MRKEEEELIAACRNDDVKTIGALVRKGANVNVQNEYGQSPLHMAIFKGARNLFETLLLLGADVNQEDCFGVSPLQRTIRLNRLKMMRRLLCEEKIKVNQVDRYGFTAIHLAAFAGLEMEDLSLIITAGGHVNQKNNWGDTPLFMASNLKTLENLLELGANPKIKNRWGERAAIYFKKRSLLNRKDLLTSLKYRQMAVKLEEPIETNVSLEKGKKRLNYLRHLKSYSFLKYKRMVWQNEKGQ